MKINKANFFRLLALVGLLAMLFLPGAPANPLPGPENRDWIYYRQLDIYFYLLTTDGLPQGEKAVFRTKGYAFFFEYWILHRSKHAQLPPVEHFEQAFARMLKKYALSVLNADDPLGISAYYEDGRFVGKPVPKTEGVEIPEAARLPQVEGLPGENLKTWKGYQQYVSDFREFFVRTAQPVRK